MAEGSTRDECRAEIRRKKGKEKEARKDVSPWSLYCPYHPYPDCCPFVSVTSHTPHTRTDKTRLTVGASPGCICLCVAVMTDPRCEATGCHKPLAVSRARLANTHSVSRCSANKARGKSAPSASRAVPSSDWWKWDVERYDWSESERETQQNRGCAQEQRYLIESIESRDDACEKTGHLSLGS